MEIGIDIKALSLSRSTISVLRNIARYDLIVFTSKNAQNFFKRALSRLQIKLPRSSGIVRVGPRNDLLKLAVRGKRILFPRSALAPHDIIRGLRSKGCSVRVITLYTAHGTKLSKKQRQLILSGNIERLYFKSPSGVRGLLQQMRGRNKKLVLSILAECLGKTTASAAKAEGFKKVVVAGIL